MIRLLILLALAMALGCDSGDPCEGSGDWQCRERFCWTLTDYRVPVCEPEDAPLYSPYNHCLIETNGPGSEDCGWWWGPDRRGEWNAR